VEELVIERLFSVAPQASLTLSNIRGAVSIQSGVAGEMAIKAVIDADSGDLKCTLPVIEQESSGNVRVNTRYDDWLPFLDTHKPCRVSYSISVPENCDLRIKTVSSSIEVHAVRGEINLESVSGKLNLSDLSGDLRLRTISGDIQGERLNGPLALDTVSGDTIVKESSLIEVDANAVSGDIYLETPLSPQDYRFRSVSGDVHVAAPQPFHHRVRMRTFSGRLRDARRLPEGSQSPSSITFNSLSGDLSLEIAESVAA
jgi:hypothetical protein